MLVQAAADAGTAALAVVEASAACTGLAVDKAVLKSVGLPGV